MEKNISIKWNFILNILLTASAFLFPVISSPYVSRILLPEGTGQIAFVTSIITYFSMAAKLGIPTYGIRACAQVRDSQKELSRTAHEIFLINLIMTLLVYFAFFLALAFIEPFRQEERLFLICSTTLILNLLGLDWLYKALEQYRDITIRSLIFNLVAIAATFLMIHKKEDYILYGAITVFAGAGSNLLSFIAARKLISFKPCGPYNLTRHLKPIFVLFALSVATTIYTHLDVVMLRFYTGSQDVGYYDAAIKVKSLLVILATSLGSVLLPRISYYMKIKEKQEFFRLIRISFCFVVLTSLPLCLYFMVMAKESVAFIFGPAYAPSVTPMQIIMPTVFFIGLTNVIGIQILVPAGHEKLVVYSTCSGALADVLLNALLIPLLGSAGAAAGTLAAEFIVLLIQLWFIRSYISVFFNLSHIIKAITAAFAALLLLLWMRRLVFSSTFILLALTFAAFFAVYGAVLFFQYYCESSVRQC